jgi:hypothetical protein
MLHIHFGTGRLGLGLVAPFFKTPESELYLLNRAVSGSNATGSTAVTPERRNALLSDHPSRYYNIGRPGEPGAVHEQTTYDGFLAYDEDGIEQQAHTVAERSAQKQAGVIVTASILKPEHYGPVLRLIDVFNQRRAKGDDIGRVFLVACENTLSAHEVMAHDGLADAQPPADVTCVRALVDRMCVSLE